MISFTMDGIEYRVYDHLYAVSRCGKVLRQMQPYTPTKHTQGYLFLGRKKLMHRVVAACWLPDFDPAKQIHHINGIKDDNRADNLECVTPVEHFRDRHRGESGKYIRTEETRKKLSKWRTGRKDTEITRSKKNRILDEIRPSRPCKFQGVLYPSASSAARAAQIPVATFRLRCKSKNFPDYEGC